MTRTRNSLSGARRTVALTVATCLGLALLVARPTVGQTASKIRPTQAGFPERPNVVLIVARSLAAADLPAYGNAEHQTPSLDRLAAEGMRFETCYATALPGASQVLLLTGQYGFRTGYFGKPDGVFAPLPQSPDYHVGAKLTFADLLRGRGYATALAGTWDLPSPAETLVRDCGFDDYVIRKGKHEVPPRKESVVGHDPGGRWGPLIVQDGTFRRLRFDTFAPDRYAEALVRFVKGYPDSPFLALYSMSLVEPPLSDTPNPAKPGGRLPRGLTSNLLYMDHLVGRLMAVLEQLDLRRRTLIVFTAANGDTRAGPAAVERAVRVPLIVSCPGSVPEGRTNRALVDLSDIFPTLAELAGAEVPDDHVLDGTSLVPTLLDASVAHREWIFSYHTHERMVRTSTWLREGDTRFFECFERRDGRYQDRTFEKKDLRILRAREAVEGILQGLPGPYRYPGLKHPDVERQLRRAGVPTDR